MRIISGKMENQFRWYILAIILLCINLPFGCGENNANHGMKWNGNGNGNVAMQQRNGELRSKLRSIPLRDDSDYIRENENEKVNPDTNLDDDYGDDDTAYDDDEYEQQQQPHHHHSKNTKIQKNDDEIVEQAQSARTQIIQRPKELSEAQIDALLNPSTTANADTMAPFATIEMCPNECSCLNDYMSCRSLRSKHLPKVPQYIQSLELPQNALNAVQCETDIKNLPNLADLKLNENKLERIPIFHGLISLKTLELVNNDIREITLDALQTLPKLTHLNLSRNRILTIGPNTFPKENIMQKLNLNNNDIEKLDRRAFETLVRLTELKVNNNRINQLPTGLFTKLKKLKKLSLNGNELRKNLQYATFSNLTALTSLKLRNNFIDELITGLFHGLDNLNALDLANNQLTEIQKGGLLNITALTKLNLANNSIHTIGKSCWEFTQKITDLDLSQNKLNEITVGTFDLLTKLRVLDLHGNQISTISSGAMNATYNLESLDLSQNRISWTIEDSFGPFSSLNKLDSFYLNDNHIKTINKNAFLGLTSLTRLDLRSNNITTIQDAAFDSKSTPALRYLLMNSTDLICDCKMSGFYFWAKNTQTIGKKQGEMNRNNQLDVRCAYPAILHGKRMLQLHKDNFTCHDTPKPQIIDEPKATILAIRGTNFTLECTAYLTVGSDIKFTWKHNNTDVDATMFETRTRRKDESRLRVKERMVERRREVNRVPLRINVSAPKVPLASSSVSKLKYDDGDDDDDYEGEDDVTSEVEENDYEMEPDQYGEVVDEVFATVEDIEASIPINSTIATSKLHLINVDHTHAGRYQCIASNDFGKAYSQKFKVTVASFPVFTKQPTNVTVKASQTVRLDCAVSGDPKPQIYWQFNFGNTFPAARERRMRIMDNDEAFIIDDVKPSDRGVYTCTAENAAGIITSNVTVDIIEPLIYIKPMEHKDVIIGEYTVLECLNSGSSLSEVRWFKNSKPILASQNRYLLTKENQLLIIAKTTEEDAGLFTCEMENQLGLEKLSIQLTVRPEPTTVNKIDNYTHDEITAIIIITVVVCAIGTSIIWIVIIYTKKEAGCNIGGMDDEEGGDNGGANGTESCLTKEHGVLGSVQISMLPKGDVMANRQIQSMRTATISRNHGVLRSNSGSSCDHSSIGVSDDIFRRYKDDCSMNNTLLRQPNHNGTDSEEDDGNDHEALLGTTYFDRYPNSVKCSDNDSFVAQMHDGVDGISSQHDTSAGNTTTAECGDDLYHDDGQQSSIKTKTSSSLSSSCHSIPPLPLNSSHEFDLNRSHHLYGSPGSHSSSAMQKTGESNPKTTPNKPVIQTVPIGKTKPTIQTNKLNELMSTFK